MEKNTLIKVANRDSGRVGYEVPEMGVNRQFASRETKEIPFAELQSLYFLPGGEDLLKNYLVIKSPEALKELGIDVEPEYFYSEEDIKKLLTQGSLDEFLDCLDFAPDGVLNMVKDLSVSLPLDNMSKRNAILEKLNFNVTRAIEIQNTKFDSGDEDTSNQKKKVERRVSTPTAATSTGRRTTIPKYEVVTSESK
jgi:hypothetical protein